MKFIVKLLYKFVYQTTYYRNVVAIFLFKLNLIPNEYRDKVRTIVKSKEYEKKFSKLNLSYDESGFYYLDPMPSKDFLKKYYEETYWQNRNDKIHPIRVRDIEHYKLLKKVYPNFDQHSKKILNFGAGHGGLSVLLHAANHQIYNFDLSKTDKLFNERWNHINELEKITDKFDLIYGSHSLEHVQNIQSFKSEARRILKPGGYIFLEVPNGNCSSNGAQLNKVDIPHTYYFEKNFFNDWLDEILICAVFQSQTNEIQNWNNFQDESGDIIRVLGSLK